MSACEPARRGAAAADGLSLLREDLRGFAGYASARSEASGGELLLNANESPWPAPDDVSALNRYPDPQPAALVDRLAELYGIDPAWLLVGRGSDEAIDLLVRATCRPGRDAVLVVPPTFGMYAVCARVHGARLVEVPRSATTLELDADALLAAVDDEVRLLFVCSPNNPTGDAIAATTIERLARSLAGRALVVVDEAYAEYCGETAVGLVNRHPNLAVLRTLSKAYGLAGARVGCLVADPAVIGVLRSIMAPYPLPTPSVQAALGALRPAAVALARSRAALVGEERERLAGRLGELPQVRRIFPSRGNFLLVRFADAAAVYRDALSAGIVLRDVSRQPGLQDCLRISIGTPQQNDRLLAVLAAAADGARQ